MKNRYADLPLLKKLLSAFLLVGLLPMLVLGINSINSANKTITTQVSNQLASITALKANEVKRYFDGVRNQIGQLSQQPIVIEGAKSLTKSFHSFQKENKISDNQLIGLKQQLGDYYLNQFDQEFNTKNGVASNADELLNQLGDEAVALQFHYIQENKHSLGNKHNLDRASDKSSYSVAHERIHPMLRTYLETFGYYDIFIADINTGQIVYSVYKELDYATSLLTGPYKDTGIAEAFRQGKQLSAKGQSLLVDFKTYRPSYDAPASFIASPIFEGDKKVGVLIFQMPLETINSIMGERAGMGETGESYLVGRDYLMRSDSYLDAKHHTVVQSFKHPETGSVDTEAVHAVFDGEKDTRIIIDYNGTPVVSSFDLLDIGEFQWAILSEQDEAEAYLPAKALMKVSLFVALACTLAVIYIGIKISQLIANPINQISKTIQAANETGNFNVSAPADGKDEVASMAKAFNALIEALSTSISDSNRSLQAVSKGDFTQTIENSYPGDIGLLTTGINETIKKISDAQEEQRRQSELIRIAGEESKANAEQSSQLAIKANEEAESANKIKQALDVASTSLMMADENNNIVYTNEALDQMMTNAESDIRKQLTHFNAKTLIGTSMDTFHKTPTHQRSIIGGLTTTHVGTISVGGRTFRLTANPITTDKGRSGTVVEWEDRTEEVAIESEIDQLVAAASQGDFSRSIELTGKTGFFLSLSRGLNQIVGTTQTALTDVSEALATISQGDLTQRVTRDYSGLFLQLKNDLNNTSDKLVYVVSAINNSSGAITTGASEIMSGMSDLSIRTEQQASSLEETAASMEEMTTSVGTSADNSQSANDLSQDAESQATSGGEVVDEAIVAMKSINDASKRISDIIGVIDEIAFQTNLLALNAAVEAARAGEQGRGFAVVASEVRQLAQRSANAAKEIKDLINESVTRVDNGTVLVNKSGETLSSILLAVKNVGEKVHQIAGTAREQASGINQVNQAVMQMDDMTQQNSALVEEASAASNNLLQQAESMAKEMEFFKIK